MEDDYDMEELCSSCVHSEDGCNEDPVTLCKGYLLDAEDALDPPANPTTVVPEPVSPHPYGYSGATPTTPPEDERKLALQIHHECFIDSSQSEKHQFVWDIDIAINLIKDYADSIRKQCAEEMGSEVWERLCPAGWEKEDWVREVAAILRKE